MKKVVLLLCLGLVALGFSGVSSAAMITFETYPNGDTPQEGDFITNQFETSHGVTFSLANGEAPVLAEYGGTAWAFYGPPGDTGADTPSEGQSVGQFFLTDDNGLGLSSDLVISYTNDVSAASGAILDIDNSEVWTITAFDGNGNKIDSIVLSYEDDITGDGIATYWSFDHGTTLDIHSIVLSGERTLPLLYPERFFGLAFDNFSPASVHVPIPSATFLLASGLIALVGVRRKQD